MNKGMNNGMPEPESTRGELAAIWIKRFKRGPMDPVDHASLVTARGIVGNANQGGRRQVTIIEEEVWRMLIGQLGSDLPPSSRRANLMVRGVELKNSRGRVLTVGAVQIRIFNETKPCERMDEALPGLKDLMYGDWRGGAFGEVVNDGEIHVGDKVAWVD